MEKFIVLTGGATGIGAAVVSRLLDKSCRVTVLDVAEPENSQSQFIQCDLSDISSIDAAIATLPPRIDVLVNVAGVSNAASDEKIMAVNF